MEEKTQATIVGEIKPQGKSEISGNVFNPKDHVIRITNDNNGEKTEALYMPVSGRVLWFHTACPHGTISAEIVQIDETKVVVQAHVCCDATATHALAFSALGSCRFDASLGLTVPCGKGKGKTYKAWMKEFPENIEAGLTYISEKSIPLTEAACQQVAAARYLLAQYNKQKAAESKKQEKPKIAEPKNEEGQKAS